MTGKQPTPMTLAAVNALDQAQLQALLLTCCQCSGWATRLASKQPYASLAELISAAEAAWATASEAEILEAFQGHPQIGDLSALRNKFKATASAEQGQVAASDESLLLALQAANNAYKQKFGFIFIVFATGKSAQQMLDLLNARLANSRAEELVTGAAEQMKITRLRLTKLVND